jgi:hypothetical protein
LLCWFFHFPRWPVILAGLAILSLLPFLLFRGTELPVSFTRSFWLAMLVFAFVNFGLYPAILRYQAGTQAGRWISRTRAVGTDPGIGISRTQGISAVYLLREAPVNYSFEFYSPVPVRTIPVDSLPATLSNGPAIVFAPSRFRDSLQKRGYSVDDLQQFPNFHISQLTGEFLNDRTRSSVLEAYSLLRINH